ncbi:DUF1361 domain-containing protein [Leuconostoc palmae]|uniref:DUF1361 domain-containing protein n=1 Tax=Leuconostoc palmae TaxID=501487 RepID=UPI001C7CD333|nr:DUF1361 domain-containing protein [Leuconostoc palmae]
MKEKWLDVGIVHLIVILFFLFVYIVPTSFTFLNWNVFLALLPFDFAIILSRVKNQLIKYIFGFFWLLFFPNTMYMMTDFIHLYAIGTELDQASQFFNYSILATGIFIGVGLGILSLEIIANAIFKKHRHLNYLMLTGLVSILSALGIYLGRYLRLNSWDVFIHFSDVMKNIILSTSYHMLAFIILFSGAQFALLVVFHYGIRYIKYNE